MGDDQEIRGRADSDSRHQICFEIQALVSRQRELSAMLEEAEESDRVHLQQATALKMQIKTLEKDAQEKAADSAMAAELEAELKDTKLQLQELINKKELLGVPPMVAIICKTKKKK
eukprot:m.486881 g.486881  ORF g.486881 m.486881 type:complete len:116 (-) comp21745_c1_seq6:1822-2169(-)